MTKNRDIHKDRITPSSEITPEDYAMMDEIDMGHHFDSVTDPYKYSPPLDGEREPYYEVTPDIVLTEVPYPPMRPKRPPFYKDRSFYKLNFGLAIVTFLGVIMFMEAMSQSSVGVQSDIGPFAMLLLIAGVGGFLFEIVFVIMEWKDRLRGNR